MSDHPTLEEIKRVRPTPLVCSCGVPLQIWRTGSVWVLMGEGHLDDVTACVLWDASLEAVMEAFLDDPGCLHLSEAELLERDGVVQ